MKKTPLRLLALFLLLAVCLAACKASPSVGDPSASATTPAKSNTATPAGDTPQPGAPALDEYEDVLTITAFFASGNNNTGNETLHHQYLLDSFKIDMQAEWGTADTMTNKLSLMIASKDMPDVVTGPISLRKTLQEFIDAGMTAPLDDYMQYLPDYRTYVTDEILDFYRNTTDGKLYFLPNQCKIPEMAENLLSDPYCFGMRTDVLELAGKGVPATMDEFYELLVAIKQKAAADSGIYKDLIPFSAYDFVYMEKVFQKAFGLSGTEYVVDDANKMLLERQMDPSFLTTMKFLSKLYREKLLDQQILTYPSRDDLFNVAKQAKFGVLYTYVSAYNSGILGALETLGIDGKYINIKVPTGVDGMSIVPWLNYSQLGTSLAMISAKASDPVRIIQYTNWQNTFVGNITTWFGGPSKEEGYWHFDENGEVMYSVEFFEELTAGTKNHNMAAPMAYPIAFPGVNQLCDVQVVLPNSTGRSEFQQSARDLGYPSRFNDLAIDRFNSLVKGEVYKSKWTDIDAIIKKYRSILITETKSDQEVETQYGKMVEELRAAGINEVQAENYEAYKSVNS